MKKIFQKIFNHPTLVEKPPVLIDIGASGVLHPIWKKIAPYSICIAFDADTRDFSLSESDDSGYKKLYLINCVVSAESKEEIDFYLTSSPYCSSTLYPNNLALKQWAFSGLFDVDSKTTIKCIKIEKALNACGIDYIDWYKSDTQGTDLRIFASLPDRVRNKIIIAEFEPGIIDAYIGEDRLYKMMAYMENHPFWVTDMVMKGSQRINKEDIQSLNFFHRKFLSSFLKVAPGWCEISYFNKFETDSSLREYLLGWILSTLKGQHGFALHLASEGIKKYNEPIFSEMRNHTSRTIVQGYIGYFDVCLRGFKYFWSYLEKLI